MILQKTVKAKLFSLTRVKEAKISSEYWNFQRALKSEDVPLYSATKQQAQRNRKRWNGIGEFPLIIRRDCFKVKELGKKIARWWAKIPVFGGSIYCPIQLPYSQEPLLKEDIRETKLVRRRHKWFLHITVQQNVELNVPSASVLAVDFGERHIATSVEYANGKIQNPKFYGTEVRGIRRHYAWLRKRLGNKKALKTIKKIGHKEKRKVDAVLHNISRVIVNKAKELNAVILLGSPNGESMRRKAKGKRFRRIVYSMPYYRLTQFIEYKALQEGIIVVQANEEYTSKACSKCGELAKRPRQDLIICPHGHMLNADINACRNLVKRFIDHWLVNGAVLRPPKTSPMDSKSDDERRIPRFQSCGVSSFLLSVVGCHEFGVHFFGKVEVG
jgi:IS605 OrfB family transposase